MGVEGYRFDQTRRDFLKFCRGVGVGLAAAPVLEVMAQASVIATEALTDKSVDNASVKASNLARCTSYEEGKCEYSINDIYEFVLEAPLKEEIIYRSVPSAMLDLTNKLTRSSEKVKSRREWGVGVMQGVLFGLLHNFTSNGFDRNTIPSPQVVVGFGLWYLQRKYGFASNFSAHAALNLVHVSVNNVSARVERKLKRKKIA